LLHFVEHSHLQIASYQIVSADNGSTKGNEVGLATVWQDGRAPPSMPAVSAARTIAAGRASHAATLATPRSPPFAGPAPAIGSPP
jgi:hypothetical protein